MGKTLSVANECDSYLQIIGCQPRLSKVMYESVKAGKLIHEESYDTLSDGTAGDVEEGSVCMNLILGFRNKSMLHKTSFLQCYKEYYWYCHCYCCYCSWWWWRR